MHRVCCASDRSRNVQVCWHRFFISRPIIKDQINAVYCVTAWHVIEEIGKRNGRKVVLRINAVGGQSMWVDTRIEDWLRHPTEAGLDVAACAFPLGEGHDQSACPISMILGDDRISRDGIGPGDEVFLTGLFSKHAGSDRSIPIIRMGNISAMPDEEIRCEKRWVSRPYLIEARSFGGLSGSPVFVQLGTTRTVDGIIKYASQPVFYLMGLMEGHWESLNADDGILDSDIVDDDIVNRIEGKKMNLDIVIVIPIAKIIEVLDRSEFKSLEESDAEIWQGIMAPCRTRFKQRHCLHRIFSHNNAIS